MPGVRGQQPQLTHSGRAAHEAVAEGGTEGKPDDSSAVSGECADGSPLSGRTTKEAKELVE